MPRIDLWLVKPVEVAILGNDDVLILIELRFNRNFPLDEVRFR